MTPHEKLMLIVERAKPFNTLRVSAEERDPDWRAARRLAAGVPLLVKVCEELRYDHGTDCICTLCLKAKAALSTVRDPELTPTTTKTK